MERQDVIKKLLNNGYTANDEALDFLTAKPQTLDQLLEARPKTQTITKAHIDSLLRQVRMLAAAVPPSSMENMIDVFRRKYEKLKSMLERQLSSQNIMSINKIAKTTKRFALVVMIKEIEEDTLVVEDTTSEIRINAKEIPKFLNEDDVVGLVCEQSEGITAEQVVWPDIALGREVRYGDGFCVFSVGADIDAGIREKYGPYIFAFNARSDGIYSIGKGGNFPDPSLVGIGEIKILFMSDIVNQCSQRWGFSSVSTCQILLKKRALDNTFLLEDLPDIVVANARDGESANYKGTTIISCGQSEVFGVNLKTRETFKINTA